MNDAEAPPSTANITSPSVAPDSGSGLSEKDAPDSPAEPEPHNKVEPEVSIHPAKADPVTSKETGPSDNTGDDKGGDYCRYSDRTATHDEYLHAKIFLHEVAAGIIKIPRSAADVEAEALTAGKSVEEARRVSQAIRLPQTSPKLRVRLDKYTVALITLLSYRLSIPKSEVIPNALRFMTRQMVERSVVNQNELAVLLHANQHALEDLAITAMELHELAIAVADQESFILDP